MKGQAFFQKGDNDSIDTFDNLLQIHCINFNHKISLDEGISLNKEQFISQKEVQTKDHSILEKEYSFLFINVMV